MASIGGRLASQCRSECTASSARGARVQVDGGKDTALRQLTAQHQLAVAGALELLEDHLVHLRARVDQRGPDDREGAAALPRIDVPRAPEKALGPLHRGGVEAAAERAAAPLLEPIVRARQSGDGVEDDHHVLPHLDLASRPLEHQLGHGDMAARGKVEGRGDHLAVPARLHFRDLLGTLVDEEDQERSIGSVRRNSLGERLEHHRLAGLGRRHDHRPLPESHRADEVDDTIGEVGATEPAKAAVECELLVRVDGGQFVELAAVPEGRRVLAVEQAHGPQ
jgi:hypothetical protein